MENKVVLITGGSSGVGQLLVSELSKKNRVITIARRIEKLIDLFGDNSNVYSYKGDLSDLLSLQRLLHEIDQEHQEVDCIINCAGIMQAGSVDNLSINEYIYSLNVNALAPLLITKHYLPKMKFRNFGRIINFTSGAPLNCFASYSAYSSSKAILNSWTLTLGKEILDYDIKINLMSPGPVRTEMAPDAPMDPIVCLPTLHYLLDEVTSSGGFYWLGYKVPLSPDLTGVDWLHGIGNDKLKKIL